MNARTSTAREASRHALFERSLVPDVRTLARSFRHVSKVTVIALMTAIAISVADAAIKPRTIVILPFVTADLGRDEQWLGEAVAQSLTLGLAQAPGLVEIDRSRLKQIPQPEAW